MARQALGKGLEALIPQRLEVEDSDPGTSGLQEVDIDLVVPNRSQPRRHFDEEKLQELGESIKARGMLQPLVVREVDGGFEIVAEGATMEGSRMVGLEKVPVIVGDYTDKEVMEVALIENLQRRTLIPSKRQRPFGGSSRSSPYPGRGGTRWARVGPPLPTACALVPGP